MKYYIGNIDEQYGEFEVEQTILFATGGNPSEIMEVIAKDWYGLDEHDSCGLREGMYWNDTMAYGAGSHYEVTKATYDELRDKRVFTEIYADEEVKYDRTPKTFEEVK